MTWHFRLAATLGLIVQVPSFLAIAADPDQPASSTARVVRFHAYNRAIELVRGSTRVVLCPEVGGRVLEFSVDGKDAMYLDEAEKTWQPGSPPPPSVGRFDYGPELTVIPHSCSVVRRMVWRDHGTVFREIDQSQRRRGGDSTGSRL